MLIKTKNKRSKLGILHLYILKRFSRCGDYSMRLSSQLDAVLLSLPVRVKLIRTWRNCTSLLTHVGRRGVLPANSSKGAAILVIAGFLAVPFFFFSYLLFQYGGIGSNHVDFAATFYIPVFDKTIDNPFRQYVNWYWLSKTFGYHLSNLIFGIIAFKGLKKKYKPLAVWYCVLITGIAFNEVFAPHGKYEFTNVLFAALFGVGFYYWNSAAVLKFLSQVVNSERSAAVHSRTVKSQRSFFLLKLKKS